MDMQSIMSMMQGGGNPEDMLKAMGGSNPQMAGLMPMLMNMNNRNRPTYGKAAKRNNRPYPALRQ